VHDAAKDGGEEHGFLLGKTPLSPRRLLRRGTAQRPVCCIAI
jgi:hypothetical protein